MPRQKKGRNLMRRRGTKKLWVSVCAALMAAAAALYLGSEDASYITGVTLLEDGGFSLF